MRSEFFRLWRSWGPKSGIAGRQTKRRLDAKRRQSSGGCLERLEARELLTVTFNGGALLTSVEAQAVYLGSDWSTNSSLQAQAKATDQFLATLVNGPYMDMLTNAGYGVGRGTASAGAVDNLGINKSVALSDAQIRTDLEALISKGQVQAPDANRLYMIYVEPGVEVTLGSANSKTSFLGYHGAFNDNGTDIHYAVMPAPGTPNPTPGSQGFGSAFDELTSVSSHELAEAVTDPNVNYKALGWYDFQFNGEIGDLAVGHESTIAGPNGIQYLVQDVVNQNDQVISPAGQPTATLTAPIVTGTALSPTVAELSWQAVNGAQGYNIIQVVGGQHVLLGSVGSSTTAVEVTGLTPGATESFIVEAFNSTSTADSSVASVTMPAAAQFVTAPQITAIATSATTVELTWNAEPQATGFNIYWSDGSQVLFLGTVSGSTTSVTVEGLQPGSTSFFLVQAFNNVSHANSQWVTVATPFDSVRTTHFASSADQRAGDVGSVGGPAVLAVAGSAEHGWGERRYG